VSAGAGGQALRFDIGDDLECRRYYGVLKCGDTGDEYSRVKGERSVLVLAPGKMNRMKDRSSRPEYDEEKDSRGDDCCGGAV